MNYWSSVEIDIGSAITEFCRWQQIPFLQPKLYRNLDAVEGLISHWGDEDNYVGEIGWMGIVPVDSKLIFSSIELRLLEDERISEKWVSVDFLEFHAKIGIIVLARMD